MIDNTINKYLTERIDYEDWLDDHHHRDEDIDDDAITLAKYMPIIKSQCKQIIKQYKQPDKVYNSYSTDATNRYWIQTGQLSNIGQLKEKKIQIQYEKPKGMTMPLLLFPTNGYKEENGILIAKTIYYIEYTHIRQGIEELLW